MGGAPITAETNRDESTLTEQKQRSLQQACLAACVADDFRARETLVLDLTGITPIADYFVLTTGTNRRQMHAIAEHVDRALAERGSHRLGLEGYDSSRWILQDYGDIVLHVFTEEARRMYDLEGLWADAPRIDWRGQVESRK